MTNVTNIAAKAGKNILQKSIDAGINLRGTVHFGRSAKELRKADPALAERWADFIRDNRAQLVSEISDIVGGAR